MFEEIIGYEFSHNPIKILLNQHLKFFFGADDPSCTFLFDLLCFTIFISSLCRVERIFASGYSSGMLKEKAIGAGRNRGMVFL
jgi:hypothetical protein